MKEAIEHHKALRTLANIITDMYGFQPQAEPDAEQALRQALTKHILIQDERIRKIAREEAMIDHKAGIAETIDEIAALAYDAGYVDRGNDDAEESPIQVGELVAVKDATGKWHFNAEKTEDGYELRNISSDQFIYIGVKYVRMTKVIEMLNNEV